MRLFIFPNQDATLYQEFPNRNTGFDEILEIGKTNEGRDSVRTLIQFDIPETIPYDAKYDLILYLADAEKVKRGQKVELWNVSQSWEEGTGYFYQEEMSSGDGVTWNHATKDERWTSGSEGGSRVDPHVSESLGYPLKDITIDVTDTVREWISGSVTNNGLVIQFPNDDESDVYNEGNLKMFSSQTHTIYKPTLVAKWDDQLYVTGSNAWPTGSMKVKAAVKTEYKQGETVRVDVGVREKYPLKTFDNILSRYSGDKYLPSSSYYSIVDDLSGTTIIPFSEESKISTNGNQSYFTFKVQNMYPLRYYRVLVKVERDGLEEIFDENILFKVK